FPVLSSIDNNKLVVLISFALASFSVVGMHNWLEGAIQPRETLVWSVRAVLPWLGLMALAMVYFRAPIHDLGLWKFEFVEVMAWVGVLAAAFGILWLW